MGADALLLRVAAYYHDIGKTIRPYFFTDNQMGRENVHNDLDPFTSAQIIIWVMIGGLGTLIGPVLGAIAIQYLVTQIGGQQVLDANLVLGTILLVFVLLLPAGVVPMVERGASALWTRARRGGRGNSAAEPAAAPLSGKALS